MAMENKRIIQLSTERTTLGDDDYTIVDSDTNGTAKYRLSRLKETDTTLSVSGMAADAAATGQAINAETQARTQAVAAETQARQQAISAESQARAAADTTLGNDVQDLKSALSDTNNLFSAAGKEQLFNKFDAIYIKDIAINSAKKLVSASGHNLLIVKMTQYTGGLYTNIINNSITLSEIKVGLSTNLYTTINNTLDWKVEGVASGKRVYSEPSYNQDFYYYLDYKLSDNSYSNLRDYVVVSAVDFSSEVPSYYKTVEETFSDFKEDVIIPSLYDVKTDLYNRVFELTGDEQIYNWRNEYNKFLYNFAINSNNQIVSSIYSFIIVAEINGITDDSFSFNIFNDTSISDISLCVSNDNVSQSATMLQKGIATSSAKCGFITLLQNAKYLYLSISMTTHPSESLILDFMKSLVIRHGVDYGTEYVDYYKLNASVDVQDVIDIVDSVAVMKSQGVLSAGKVLVVGNNGEVLAGEISEELTTNVPVRYYPTKTLTLDTSIINGSTVFSGTGWTGSLANGFTHSTGNTDALEFDVNTTADEKYLVTFDCETLATKFYVSIGDSQLVDPYNGGTGMYVGFVADGGKLKITPASNFNGTITNLKLRKLNSSGTDSFTYNCSEIEHGSMVNDISGFWNIAIGGPHVLSHNQNGARNIGIGYGSLEKLNTGIQNIVVGTWSMPEVTTGTRNVAVGCDVLYGRVYQGEESKAFDNVAIGKATMRNGTLIEKNVAIGMEAMHENTEDASENVAIGYSALAYANKKNVGIGRSAGAYNKGNGNTSIGYNAGNTQHVNGNNNVCIGIESGFKDTGASAGNILNVDNAIAIGTGVKAGNNEACIGNANQTIILAGKTIVFNQDGTVSWS